jgi:hypothetical protein
MEISTHEILNFVLRIKLKATNAAPNCNSTDTIRAIFITINQNYTIARIKAYVFELIVEYAYYLYDKA